MPNKQTCPKCAGCGKVDDKEGKPWLEITQKRNPSVLSGELQPLDCPECKGAGILGAESKGAVAAPDMHSISPPDAQKLALATNAPIPVPSENAGHPGAQEGGV